MNRTLLALGAGAALVTAVGGALAAAPDTLPAQPTKPAQASGKPTTTGKPASPGASATRTRDVIVTYNFWGSVANRPGDEMCPGGTSLATGTFALDVSGGNKHAMRLLSGGNVDVAGTEPITVRTAAGTQMIGATGAPLEAGPAGLACGDTVRVSYRMKFRTTGRTSTGKPVAPGISAMTMDALSEKVAQRVRVTPTPLAP